MTEAEWLACEDSRVMLAVLTGADHPRRWGRCVSDRKLRLFACAVCRQAWGRLTDPRSRRAVEVAECYADGLAGEGELEIARVVWAPWNAWNAAWVSAQATQADALRAASWTAGAAVDAGVRRETQAALLRDIVGNPFRPAYRCGPGVIDVVGSDWDRAGVKPLLFLHCWLTPAVVGIARRVYDGRDFDALPVLADALEEAGCQDEAVLRHLRGWEPCPDCLGTGSADSGGFTPNDEPISIVCECVTGWVPLRGPHARGCWALDLVLGLI
jgi:hypothetical protein